MGISYNMCNWFTILLTYIRIIIYSNRLEILYNYISDNDDLYPVPQWTCVILLDDHNFCKDGNY
jgi:hypothetical protein